MVTFTGELFEGIPVLGEEADAVLQPPVLLLELFDLPALGADFEARLDPADEIVPLQEEEEQGKRGQNRGVP